MKLVGCVAVIVCVGEASGGEIADAAAFGPSAATVSGAVQISNTGKRCPKVKPSETLEGPAPEATAPVVLAPNARDIVLCRYWSLEIGRKAENLASVHVLRRRSLVRSIVEEMNGLQPAVQGEHTCPSDSGALVVGLLGLLGRDGRTHLRSEWMSRSIHRQQRRRPGHVTAVSPSDREIVEAVASAVERRLLCEIGSVRYRPTPIPGHWHEPPVP